MGGPRIDTIDRERENHGRPGTELGPRPLAVSEQIGDPCRFGEPEA